MGNWPSDTLRAANRYGSTSTQISQEADLGAQATYSLVLGRSTVDVRSFELKVLNLPQQIDYSFVDPTTEARLSQLVARAFSQRRKTIRNALRTVADETTLEAAGIDPGLRPEDVPIAGYVRLANTLE